ncbi:MAG: DUF5684 domain-containing protein [Oscillospiraceae bacterium]|nr:DUF5684 domain-containing protein [Oscillospiraceae bacterium]
MYYNYDYGMANRVFHMSAGSTFFSLLLGALAIVSLWFIFQKANEPGWAAIVPFYNLYVLFKITWGSGWMFLLLLIPIANFVIMIITYVKLAKAFGKGGGFACGIIFLSIVFLPIMAFSKDIVYVGVPGKEGQYNAGYGPQGYQQPGYQQGYQNPYSQGYQAPQQPYQAPDAQQGTYTQPSAQNPDYFYQQQSAPSGPKFCPGCGAPVEGNPKYCPKCGKAL